MPDTLTIAVFGRRGLENRSAWGELLEAVERTRLLTPEQWGVDETTPETWTSAGAAVDRAASARSFWGRVGQGGTVRLLDRRTPFDLHTWFEANVPVHEVDTAAAVGVLEEVARVLDGAYGHVHVLDPAAWGEDRLPYAKTHETVGARLSIPPWVLELYVPHVYWGTVLGPDYVAMFGRDRIASTPCEAVEELDAERFFLQATPDLNDCRTAHHEYAAAARRMIDHLGRDAFRDPSDYRRPGRTPDFSYLRDVEPPRPYVPLAP